MSEHGRAVSVNPNLCLTCFNWPDEEDEAGSVERGCLSRSIPCVRLLGNGSLADEINLAATETATTSQP